MAQCSGCFPIFQPNQLAHMEIGGCMELKDDDFYCLPVNLESVFDSVAEEEKSVLEKKSEPVRYNADVNECVICWENIEQVNNCVTPCGHSFCFKCLMLALTRNPSCPCCRTSLIEQNEEEEDEDEENEENSHHSEDDEESYGEGEEDCADVEDIATRLESSGFTMLDMVLILMDKPSKRNAALNYDYIQKMAIKFDQIEQDVDNEAKERVLFAAEDNKVN
jgi:hypothetical protein